MERSGPPPQFRDRHSQLQFGYGIQQLIDRVLHDEHRHRTGRAAVRTGTECQMGSIVGHIAGTDRRIVVAGGHADHHRLVCRQPDIVDQNRLARIADAVVGHGRIVEQHLVQRVSGRQTSVQHVRREPVVGQHQQQGVRDEVLHRFDSRPVQRHELVQHLFVVQPHRMFHQPAGDIVARLGALDPGQFE